MKLLVITQKVDENDQLLGFFIDWIRELSRYFEKVNVLCLEKGGFHVPSHVEVQSVGKDRGVSKIGQLFNFYEGIISSKNEYDAVFIHMNPIWVILGSWYWRLVGKKVCMWYAHKSVTLKLKIAEKLADIVFTSTPEGFRIPSGKVVVVGQGINIDLFRFDKTTRPELTTIISVGRVAPVKNYEPLIAAMKLLKDEGTRARLSIIGEPALKADIYYEATLKSMVTKMGLENNIIFVGKIKNQDLPPYYRKNNLYINLSNTGSLDKTILEAMASGCLILSSNDSARTFLPGKMVVSSMQPEKLAQQIRGAFSWDVGEELRNYVVRNHSLESLAEKISKSILESRRSGKRPVYGC